jgi:exopolysaccharide biosynthesis polyprenyl glycosylphosphotransferase
MGAPAFAGAGWVRLHIETRAAPCYLSPMQRSWKVERLWIPQLASDIVALVAAYYVTLFLRFRSAVGARFFDFVNQALGVRETGALGNIYERFYLLSVHRILFLLAATLFVLYALRGLYAGRRFVRPRPLVWNILVANVAALAVFFPYFYLRRNVWHPRSFFITLLACNTVFAAAGRALLDGLLRRLRTRMPLDNCPALLIGAGDDASFLNVLIGELRPHGIRIAERLPCDPEEPFESLLDRVRSACAAHGIEMIIAAEPTLTIGRMMQLLEIADDLGAPVKMLSPELDILINEARLPADIIRGVPLVHFNAPAPDGVLLGVHRLVSSAAAAILLAGLLPLMGLIALLIRLTSRGPALFVQERIGVNRQPFRIYKFRTMYDQAAELQAQVEEFNESGPGIFKMRRDPRVTPVGRVLRRFSLDELPQLLNVLRGEMLLVGPRPLPRRDFENYYEEWHYSRHRGMPGLTCLWQVSGRSNLDFHTMCLLDVYYLRNHNWILDIQIILRTLWVVCFAKGAY